MRKWIREYFPVVLTVVFVLAARSSLADHYVVPTGSMEPTLVPGDRVLVDKTAYGLRIPFTSWVVSQKSDPQAGEIVIFDSPADGTRLIKRVVAVAGDRVSLRNGRLEINGTPLAMPTTPLVEHFPDHTIRLSLQYGGGPDIPLSTVPDGHVLVLGDSRGNSRDSRYFGFVPVETLYARAVGIYFRSDDGIVWLPLSPKT